MQEASKALMMMKKDLRDQTERGDRLHADLEEATDKVRLLLLGCVCTCVCACVRACSLSHVWRKRLRIQCQE